MFMVLVMVKVWVEVKVKVVSTRCEHLDRSVQNSNYLLSSRKRIQFSNSGGPFEPPPTIVNVQA